MALKKGICKNYGNCPLADNEEIQEVDSSEFFCTYEPCQKPLHEITPPPPPKKWIYIVIATIIIICGGLGAYFGFFRGSGESVLLSLNKETIKLNVGDFDTLIVTVTTQPIDASVSVLFTSSDENVVQVDNNGLVKAISQGESSIIVIAKNKNGIADTAKANVTVSRSSDDSVRLSLSLNKDAITFAVGNFDTLKAAVVTTPDSPDANVSVSFTSDNSNVAQVDNAGVVRAVAKGETTITVVAWSPKGTADTVHVKVAVNDVNKKGSALGKNPTGNWGKITMDWYVYEGPCRNGKPADGVNGEMRITKYYQIDLKDGRGSTLEVNRGDVIVNPKFKDGKFMLQGELHRPDGTRRVL